MSHISKVREIEMKRRHKFKDRGYCLRLEVKVEVPHGDKNL